MKTSIIFLASLFLAVNTSRIEIQDGGYKKIVVGISEKIRQDQCADIIRNIKLLFYHTSEALNAATRKAFHFEEIRIVIPRSWNHNFCNGYLVSPATFEKYDSSDVRVSPPVYPYGQYSLWTEQPGQCGEHGRFISMPPGFLTKPLESAKVLGSREKALLLEWAKLRYGVFEEKGYPGDPIYPSYYKTYEGSEKVNAVTDCSNIPVKGTTVCNENNPSKCVFHAFTNASNEGVVSSVMSYPYLSHVSSFCDSSTHIPEAPTKHNLMCGGMSTWDIITQSADYLSTNGTTYEVTDVDVRVVQEQPKKIILLIDDGEEMNEAAYDRWTLLRQAVSQFILDLPDETRLGFYMYANVSGPTKSYGLTELSDQTREDILDGQNFPMYAQGKTHRDLLKSVIWALGQLNSEYEGAEIVLIPAEPTIPHNWDKIIHKLFITGIKVHVIIYPRGTDHRFTDVAQVTGGRSFFINEEILTDADGKNMGNLVNMESLVDTLNTLIPAKRHRGAIVHREVMNVPNPNSKFINGEFYIDEKLGKNTTISLYTFWHPHYQAQLVDLEDKNGIHTKTPPTPTVNEVAYELFLHDALPGIWTYRVAYLKYTEQPVVLKIRSYNILPDDEVTMECWTNWDGIGYSGNPLKSPLIVYAKVIQAGSPVTGVQVTGSLEHVVHGQMESSRVFRLVDDGKTVPDTLGADGIYSGYVTGFTSRAMQYNLKVTAISVPGSTKVLTATAYGEKMSTEENPKPDYLYCCGSMVPKAEGKDTAEFQLQSYLGTYTVEEPVSGDWMSPSRVIDLQVTITSYTAFLTWTAPGGDYNSGAVTAYEIKYSTNVQYLLKNFDDCPSLPGPAYPKLFGNREEIPIAISGDNDSYLEYNTHYYVALRGLDQLWRGGISNIAQIYTPLPPTIPPTTDHVSSTPLPTNTTAASHFPYENRLRGLTPIEIAGIVGGGVGFLIIIALIAVYYYMITRKKKNVPQHHSDHGNGKLDFVKSSANTEFSEEGGFGTQENGTISTISGTQPQFMSASQLLDEHEKRRSMVNTPPGSRCSHITDGGYTRYQRPTDADYGTLNSRISNNPNPLPKPVRYDLIPERGQAPEGVSHNSESFVSLTSDGPFQHSQYNGDFDPYESDRDTRGNRDIYNSAKKDAAPFMNGVHHRDGFQTPTPDHYSASKPPVPNPRTRTPTAPPPLKPKPIINGRFLPPVAFQNGGYQGSQNSMNTVLVGDKKIRNESMV